MRVGRGSKDTIVGVMWMGRGSNVDRRGLQCSEITSRILYNITSLKILCYQPSIRWTLATMVTQSKNIKENNKNFTYYGI